jgi:hypothetical protein
MTVITSLTNTIIAVCESAERVDDQGEKSLIKVVVDANGGFYYIGTVDRDTYVITNGVTVPSDYPGVTYTFDGVNFTKA